MARSRLYTVLPIIFFTQCGYTFDCVPFYDSTNKYNLEFGVAELGTEVIVVADLLGRNSNCYESEDKKYIDCEYFDDSGVSYTVEGTRILKKEIKSENLSKLDRQPFNLSYTDHFQDAVKKFHNLDNELPNWTILYDENDIVLASDFCFKNKNGNLFSLSLTFNSETLRLEKIISRLNWQ